MTASVTYKETGRPPTVGRIVHYVSYGTPGGEFASECRAAVVTEVEGGPGEVVSLAVLNPTGAFFNRGIQHSEAPGGNKVPGTWHWPELV